MPNRQLNAEELSKANALLSEVRNRLAALAGEDTELLFAFRRKVYKELGYDERGKPIARRKLKAAKREEQGGKCKLCNKKLPETYCVLDRLVAIKGYTIDNTQLICQECDTKTQSSRGYA